MREDLKPHSGIRSRPGDCLHLGKREFPGEHHPREPHGMRPPHPLSVVDGKLGRGMENKARYDLPCESCETGVLHQHRINSRFVQPDKVLKDIGEFPVVHQRIDRHVHLHAPGVGVRDRFRDLLPGKILRELPCAKPFPAQVNRIGPGCHGGKERLRGTGWCEQFGDLLLWEGNRAFCHGRLRAGGGNSG
ncbi:MAG: hypothetical protein WB759_00205 [Methanoregula sp.]